MIVGVLVLIRVLPPDARATIRLETRTSVTTPGSEMPPLGPGLLKNVQVPLAYVAPAQPVMVEH